MPVRRDHGPHGVVLERGGSDAQPRRNPRQRLEVVVEDHLASDRHDAAPGRERVRLFGVAQVLIWP